MKKKLLPLIWIVFLMVGCNTSTQKETPEPYSNKSTSINQPSTTKKQLSQLDSIRNSIAEAYENVREYQGKETVVLSNSYTASNADSPCIPCDINFLVYLNGKSDFTLEDIKQLMCLDNHDECDDNAEFVVFYNEMIFKVFNRERKDLSLKQLDSLLQDHELVEELKNPLFELNSKTLINRLENEK